MSYNSCDCLVSWLKFDDAVNHDELDFRKWIINPEPSNTPTSNPDESPLDFSPSMEFQFGTSTKYNGLNRLYSSTPTISYGDFSFHFWCLVNSSTWSDHPYTLNYRIPFYCNFSYLTDSGAPNRFYIHNIATKQQKSNLSIHDKTSGSDVQVKASSLVNADCSLDVWHHFAITYQHDPGTWRYFIDGKLVDSFTYQLFQRKISRIGLGGWDNFTSQDVNNNLFYFDGFMENFMFFNDICLWKSDFTPPTREYYDLFDVFLKCKKLNQQSKQLAAHAAYYAILNKKTYNLNPPAKTLSILSELLDIQTS